MKQKSNLIILLLSTMIFIMGCGIRIMYGQLENKEEQIAKLTETVSEQELAIQDYEVSVDAQASMFAEQFSEFQECLKIVQETDQQAIEMKSVITTLQEEIVRVDERISKYEEYEYAIYDNGGNRTDITYDQLILGETLMEEKGLDPNLLFGMIMTESRGNEDSKNVCSSAAGYGQFLYSTGKFTYENVLGNGSGTYSTGVALDGDKNIEMMAAYLDYLAESNDDNIYATLQCYRGRGGTILDGYIAKIDSYISTTGVTVAEIARLN